MCNFFSYVTDPEKNAGRRFYFDKRQREELTVGSFDSHSTICAFYGLKEDECNKYEYNPTTKIFTADTIHSPVDDRAQAEDWVRKLNFAERIYPEIKNIYGLKIGDKLGFRPLRDIRKDDALCKISCGWNENGDMDYLCKKRVNVVVTPEFIENLVADRNFLISVDDWSISKDMLKMPEIK